MTMNVKKAAVWFKALSFCFSGFGICEARTIFIRMLPRSLKESKSPVSSLGLKFAPAKVEVVGSFMSSKRSLMGSTKTPTS